MINLIRELIDSVKPFTHKGIQYERLPITAQVLLFYIASDIGKDNRTRIVIDDYANYLGLSLDDIQINLRILKLTKVISSIVIAKGVISVLLHINIKSAINSINGETKRKKSKTVRKSNTHGYVYLAHVVGYPYFGFKIGCSRKPESRNIQGQIPINCDILHKFKSNDMFKAEKMLHNKYQAKNTKGEWFSLCIEDIAEIAYLDDYDL